MIMLGAKSDIGNAIHIVMGPESDLFMDIHGALSVDIDTVVKAVGTDKPLTVMVTRCRSEADLGRELDRRGIPFTVASQSCGQAPAEPQVPAKAEDNGPDLDTIRKHELPGRQKKG